MEADENSNLSFDHVQTRLLKLQATDDVVLQKLLDQERSTTPAYPACRSEVSRCPRAKAGRVSKLDGMGWMTLILALRVRI